MEKYIKKNIVFLLVILSISFLFSEGIVTKKKKRKNFFIYPILGYSDEIGFEFGAISIFNQYSRVDTTKIPNEYQLIISYSTKKQFELNLNAEMNLSNKNKWEYELEFRDYPNDFYGIGNETLKNDLEKYNVKKFIFNNDFYTPIYKKTELIFSNSFGIYRLDNFQENGLLETNNYLGSENFRCSGIGIGLQFDSSDHRNYPTKGGKVIFKAETYAKYIGSDYNFSRYRLEIDKYIKVHSSAIFGIQGLIMSSEGEIPFQKLFYLGNNMRGIKSTRFMDKNLITLRSELRMMPFLGNITKKISFVVFSEQGEVSNRLSKMNSDGIKFTYGIGLRYRLFEKEKMNLGFDIGFFKDSMGFAVNFKEAF